MPQRANPLHRSKTATEHVPGTGPRGGGSGPSWDRFLRRSLARSLLIAKKSHSRVECAMRRGLEDDADGATIWSRGLHQGERPRGLALINSIVSGNVRGDCVGCV